MECDWDIEEGKNSHVEVMKKLDDAILEWKRLQRQMSITKVPGFTGGQIFREFHINCSTGYPVIDAEISNFITNSIRKLEPGAILFAQYFCEIKEELSTSAHFNEIKLEDTQLDEMATKIFIDMFKVCRKRNRRDLRSTLSVYCKEDLQAYGVEEEEDEKKDQLAMDELMAELLVRKENEASAGFGVKIG